MYCKLRIEFSHPVLRPERKACQTVLVVFLLYYALVQFLWKLFSRKVKVSLNCSFTWNIRFRTCADRAYRKLNVIKNSCYFVITLTNLCKNNCSFRWHIRFRTCPDRAYRKLNAIKNSRYFVITLTNLFKNNLFTLNIRFRTCPDRAYRKLNIKKNSRYFVITLINLCKNNCSFTWNIRFRTCPDRVYRKLNIQKRPRKCLVDFRNNQSVFVVSDRNIFNKKQLLS